MLIHTVEDEARGRAVTRGKTAALKYPERKKKKLMRDMTPKYLTCHSAE